jgi:hypothetical protein
MTDWAKAPTYFTEEHVVSMTLRDHFAGLAMQSILMSTKISDCRVISKDAYVMADAMLETRKK